MFSAFLPELDIALKGLQTDLTQVQRIRTISLEIFELFVNFSRIKIMLVDTPLKLDAAINFAKDTRGGRECRFPVFPDSSIIVSADLVIEPSFS